MGVPLPTCLVLVNRVLLECGVGTVTTMNPGTRESNVTLEALNDASNDIRLREKWPFRRALYTFLPVAGLPVYPLDRKSVV